MRKAVVALSLGLALLFPLVNVLEGATSSYVAITTEIDTDTVKQLQHGANG